MAEFGRPGKIMQAIGSDLVLRDCLLARARMGPEVQGTGVLCANTWRLEMFGPDDSDGIYLCDQSTGQELRLVHSVMGSGDDDGIDTLNATATIEDCILRNWANPNEDAKGISAFNGVVNVDRCLIVDCWGSISGKWSSGPAARININHSTIIGISNTIAANGKANAPGPFIDFRITNSILWRLDALKTDFGDTNFSLGYCDLSESWAGTGNFFSDPRFADEAGHDYRLSPGSSCINAGDPRRRLIPTAAGPALGCFHLTRRRSVHCPWPSRHPQTERWFADHSTCASTRRRMPPPAAWPGLSSSRTVRVLVSMPSPRSKRFGATPRLVAICCWRWRPTVAD